MPKNQYRAETKMESRVCFILMKAGVTGPEIDECMAWAFGPNAWYVPIYPDWYYRWHKLHPEFPAKKNMSFVEWMFVIGTLFVNWKIIKLEHEQQFKNLN